MGASSPRRNGAASHWTYQSQSRARKGSRPGHAGAPTPGPPSRSPAARALPAHRSFFERTRSSGGQRQGTSAAPSGVAREGRFGPGWPAPGDGGSLWPSRARSSSCPCAPEGTAVRPSPCPRCPRRRGCPRQNLSSTFSEIRAGGSGKCEQVACDKEGEMRMAEFPPSDQMHANGRQRAHAPASSGRTCRVSLSTSALITSPFLNSSVLELVPPEAASPPLLCGCLVLSLLCGSRCR